MVQPFNTDTHDSSSERGNYPLAMIDWIIKAADRDPEAHMKFGILYDIGCNLEKSINKVGFSSIYI